MIKEIPEFNLFIENLFRAGKTEWNPNEHEDWELPPKELLKLYLQEYPLNDEEVKVIEWIPDKDSVYAKSR